MIKSLETKMARLHNRRIFLTRLSNGNWLIRTKKLITFNGKRELMVHRFSLTNEAMENVLAMHALMADETYQVKVDMFKEEVI